MGKFFFTEVFQLINAEGKKRKKRKDANGIIVLEYHHLVAANESVDHISC